MIYSRFHSPVTIVRRGTLADVRTYENREPDEYDRQNVEADCYVIIRYADTGKEALTHLAYLRADGALPEIMDAIRATDGCNGCGEAAQPDRPIHMYLARFDGGPWQAVAYCGECYVTARGEREGAPNAGQPADQIVPIYPLTHTEN